MSSGEKREASSEDFEGVQEVSYDKSQSFDASTPPAPPSTPVEYFYHPKAKPRAIELVARTAAVPLPRNQTRFARPIQYSLRTAANVSGRGDQRPQSNPGLVNIENQLEKISEKINFLT